MWNKITILILSGLLSGCGAGLQTTKANWSTVSIFNDASGVFRVVNTKKGLIGGGISPNVVNEVNAANKGTGATAIDVSSFALLSSNSLGKIRQGTISLGSTSANITVYQNTSESADLTLTEVPNTMNFLIHRGKILAGYPVGNYTYTGQHAMGRKRVGVTPELGSFSLNANFNSGTYTYTGSTANTSLVGSGLIDKVNGGLAGNSFTLSLRNQSSSYSTTMYGNFHGNNAVDVSGIFHTNDSNPDYAGGFVGSR